MWSHLVNVECTVLPIAVEKELCDAVTQVSPSSVTVAALGRTIIVSPSGSYIVP